MGKKRKLITADIFFQAVKDSFAKLNPAVLVKNPVMFIVEICAFITTIISASGIYNGNYSGFDIQITVWLWFTVLFANFAEAVAEGRGKAQADSLRKNKKQVIAKKILGPALFEISADELKKGDVVVCVAGDTIPADGEIIEGVASVDESAITGESAPVIREAGGDRSAVTGGTMVLSDKITIRIVSEPGYTFMDKIISLIEGARRQKTPNEIALTILLAGLTIIFLLAVTTLPFYYQFGMKASGIDSGNLTIPVLVALLVCLIPTTIGGLLSAIGISGMDRMIKRNVIAMSGRAIEAAGDLDVLLLDKTGTITLGNRMASGMIPLDGVSAEELADAALLSSLSDDTPEGRSIIKYVKEVYHLKSKDIHTNNASYVKFSAETRMSGINIYSPDGGLEILEKARSMQSKNMSRTQAALSPMKRVRK